jgi:hypothetical protein
MGDIICKPMLQACASMESLNDTELTEDRYGLGTPSPPPGFSSNYFTDI